MDAKYYMIPNQEMFRSNLLSGEFNIDSATKIQLSLICADKMLFDQLGTSWEIHYHSKVPLQKSTIETAVRIFKSKFSLVECRFIEIESAAVTNTTSRIVQNKTELVNNPRKENPKKKMKQLMRRRITISTERKITVLSLDGNLKIMLGYVR